jgi:glycosyltransferase 2 family protein
LRSPKADVTSTTAQTIIHRLSGRRISAAISVLVLAVAVFTLYRLVRDVELAKVVAALEAQPIEQIAVAAAYVVAGYFTLTFYDLFALRMIGCHAVPYPVAALASFTSSTIGHSLGAAVLTGGLVRLRIYATWGLTIIDVGKIAVITGMTFWLGNAFLLGGAATYAPETVSSIDHLPSSVNRAIGVAALSAIACYLAWLAGSPRAVGRSPWRLVLPNMRFTLLQIGIGATDLCLVTLAMYTLLPSSPSVGFLPVFVTFLTAAFLGTVSHAPGGLGVIEATMLIGLPQFPREEFLAALLTFRVLYFLLPLCLAALSLGLRELRMLAAAEGDARRPPRSGRVSGRRREHAAAATCRNGWPPRP